MKIYIWGANDRVVGKADPQKLSYAGAWQDTQGTLQELAEHIGKGHPWMPAILGGNRKRWQSNANYAELLSLDIDDGLTIDEALEHPFIAKHCGLGIESSSSTPQHHKFRLVFPLASPVEGSATIKLCNQYLQHLVRCADPSCKDASRFYFGGLGRTPFLLQDGTLPHDFVDQAKAWSDSIEAAKAEEQKRIFEERQARRERVQALGGNDAEDLIEQCNDRLGVDAFLRYLESEKHSKGSKIRVKPAFRSGSGSFSAFLSETNGVWLYHDPAGAHSCDGFRFFVWWQRGERYKPRGAEFWELLREYATIAGVDVPEFKPQNRIVPNHPRLKADPFFEWNQAMWRGYDRRRKFTVTETINERFLPTIPQGKDIAIKSAMETGKTHALCEYFKTWQGGAILLGSRNSLLLQTIARLNESGANFTHHTDSGLKNLRSGRVGFCFDSLLKVDDEDFEQRILILDESVSGIKHLITGGTLRGRRARILVKFEQAVKRAAHVILLDGTQNNTVVEYVERLRGKAFYRLNNEFKPALLNVTIANPEKNRDASHVMGTAIKAASEGEGIVFVSDSQRLCEAMDITLTALGIKTFRIDSKTCCDQGFKKLIANPKLGTWLNAQGIGAVLLSPSAESGIDIKAGDHFSKGFAVFWGILDTDTQMQIIRRSRDTHDWLIHCAPYTIVEGKESPSETTYSKQHLESISLEMVASAIDGADLSPLLEQLKACPHWQTKAKLEASRAWERRNTRECLIRSLEEGGHAVTVLNVLKDDATRRSFKEIRKAIIAQDSKAIFQANKIDIESARMIKSSFNCTLQQRWEAERAILLDRLPGLENTALWHPKTVERLLFTDRHLITKLENFWMIQNLDFAVRRSKLRSINIGKGESWIGDLHPQVAKLRYLFKLGILSLADGETIWTAENPEILRIYNSVRRSTHARALGFKPGLCPLKFIGETLANFFGCGAKRSRDGEDRGSIYSLPAEAELLGFIDARMREKYSDQKLLEKTAETLAPHSFEPVQTQHIYTSLPSEGSGQTKTLMASAIEGDPPIQFLHQSQIDRLLRELQIAGDRGDEAEAARLMDQIDRLEWVKAC